MPTVRLTKKLNKSIEAAAEKITIKQLADLPTIEAKDAKEILTSFIKEHSLEPHSAEYLNSKITAIDIEGIIINDDKHAISFDVPLTKMLAPHTISYTINTLEFKMDEIEYCFPEKHWKIIMDVLIKGINIKQECAAFKLQINSLLSRCTTIKQFIEAWPPGEQFIPTKDLQKHYEQEKKTRKRGVYLEDEELQNLNSLLLTSKII